MIAVAKLAKLAPRHRMRKAALVLAELEREALARPDSGRGSVGSYLFALAALLLNENQSPEPVLAASARLSRAAEAASSAAAESSTPAAAEAGTELVRAIDQLRHALLAASGQAPADWDLIDPRTGAIDAGTRRVYASTKAYLEDLRSPFNVGSVFRTADALGLEELILSPACADPGHPRAQRSAMGAVDLVAWRRSSLEALGGELPLFALELGGESLESFEFPSSGIVILGSEELGISREARELCTYGTVSIPMMGAKASLNVAVAFGILMHAWTSSLRRLGLDTP